MLLLFRKNQKSFRKKINLKKMCLTSEGKHFTNNYLARIREFIGSNVKELLFNIETLCLLE